MKKKIIASGAAADIGAGLLIDMLKQGEAAELHITDESPTERAKAVIKAAGGVLFDWSNSPEEWSAYFRQNTPQEIAEDCILEGITTREQLTDFTRATGAAEPPDIDELLYYIAAYEPQEAELSADLPF
jgi:hypothetical protein